MTQAQSYQTYEVTLSSGVTFIVAPNSERAAWSALELSVDSGHTLLNVRLADDW